MDRLSAPEAAEELEARLKVYSLDDAIGTIAHICATYENREARVQLPEVVRDAWFATVFPWQLAYLVRALIELSSNDQPVRMRGDDFLHLTRLFNQAQGIEFPGDSTSTDLHALMLRIGYQQLSRQDWQRPHLLRTLQLYSEIAQRPGFTKDFNIPIEFERSTGLTVTQFIAIGMTLFGKVLSEPRAARFFELDKMARDDVEMLSSARLSAFARLTVATYDDFRRGLPGVKPVDPKFRFSAFNVLHARPIVRTERSGYIVPIPSLLLDRVTLGIYHDLGNVDRQRFTRVLGKSFETYVGELLAAYYDESELIPELSYSKSQNKSSDWATIEDDAAVLIECKARPLSLETKVTGDPALLRWDLTRGKGSIVEGLVSLHRVMHDIEARRPGLDPFYGRALIPVVLTYEPYYFAGSPLVREMISQELRAKGIQPFDYQIISVDEIEGTLPLIRQRGFAKLLAAKLADKSTPTESSAFISFHDYLGRIAPGETRRVRHPLLEARRRDLDFYIARQFGRDT